MKQDYDQAIIQFKQQQEQQQKSLQDKIVQYENELQNAKKSQVCVITTKLALPL